MGAFCCSQRKTCKHNGIITPDEKRKKLEAYIQKYQFPPEPETYVLPANGQQFCFLDSRGNQVVTE